MPSIVQNSVTVSTYILLSVICNEHKDLLFLTGSANIITLSYKFIPDRLSVVNRLAYLTVLGSLSRLMNSANLCKKSSQSLYVFFYPAFPAFECVSLLPLKSSRFILQKLLSMKDWGIAVSNFPDKLQWERSRWRRAFDSVRWLISSS